MRHLTLLSFLVLILAVACSPIEPMFNHYADESVANEKSAPTAAPPPRRSRMRVSGHPAMSENIILAGDRQVVSIFQFCSSGERLGLMDFVLENDGDHQTVYAVTVEYRDTSGSLVTSSAALSSGGTATFINEDMYIPRCARSRAIMAVYVVATAETVATPGMTMQLNWSDAGAVATGIYSGNSYNHRAMTDYVEGTEMVWHITEPTIALSSYSPSGTSIPGMQEVLRFNLSADSGGDIDPLDGFTFEFNSTDNAGTGWNTCAMLADPAWFAVYNLNMYGTSLELDADLDWSFHTADGTECSSAPSDILDYAVIGNLGEIVNAGITYTYSLYFDSTGASAASDDSTQFNVTDLEWSYYAAGSDTFYGDLIDGIPLTGNAMMF